MPSDICCPVTGWMPMRKREEFVADISGLGDGDYLWDSRKAVAEGWQVPSEVVRKGLEYTWEDVDATNDCVLVTPCEVDGDGEPIVEPDRLTPEPEAEGGRAVTYVFTVCPASSPSHGVYFKYQEDDILYYGDIGRGRIVIHFCAFLILQHLIPGLRAQALYEFLTSAASENGWGTLQKVDYGPVERIHQPKSGWGRIAGRYALNADEEGRDTHPGEKSWWLKLLTQKDKSDDEVLEDAWMGVGNMWVFKHPGLFPIARAIKLAKNRTRIQAMTSHTDNEVRFEVINTSPLLMLPAELMEIIFNHLSPRSIFRLISTTKTLHNNFRLRLDQFAQIWIRQQRPWYLPVGPINYEGGNAEIMRWRSNWQELTNARSEWSEIEKEIPWFPYYLACRRSPNMRSRRRIWGIVLQIKDLLASASAPAPPTEG